MVKLLSDLQLQHIRYVKKDQVNKKTLEEVLSEYLYIHTCFELTEKMVNGPKNKKWTEPDMYFRVENIE